MASVSLTINGKQVAGDVEDRTLLVDYIRGNAGLTGTHVGCDTSQCGACVVLVNGKAVKSCTMLAAQADGADVVTVEGIADGDTLHPVQAAFRENHGLQCGFCTPGHDHRGCRYDQSPWWRARRSDDPGRTRRQHLPLHRLPQYRQGHSGRRKPDVWFGCEAAE